MPPNEQIRAGRPGRPSVLIVDDEPDMRRLLRMVMLKDDIDVIAEAGDGHAALATYRDVQQVLSRTPSVVILDNRMPGLSGLEVAREILADDPGQRIVLVPATLDDDLCTKALGLGISRVVSKREILALAGIVRSLTDEAHHHEARADQDPEAATPRRKRLRWRG